MSLIPRGISARWVRELSLLPNTRLKLAAPVLNESGCHLERSGGRFSFVINSAWRRSLRAIR